MTQTKKTGPESQGRKIMIITQDPVARELMQKKYRRQIKPSKKVYDRKKQRQAARRVVSE
ncbi:MAG: hypothetical protein KC553_07785 [Nitrospina sp.]|nr:hypothetical protein [Nitrospina sp.]